MLDLRDLDWEYSSASGTCGVYLKSKYEMDNKTYFIKLSSFDKVRGFIGTESVNEVITGRLGKILGLPVLNQELIQVLVKIDDIEYTTYGCISESYKKGDTERISAGDMYEYQKEEGETPINSLRRLGYSKFVDSLLIWDYLIMGKDRHSSNIEFLRTETGIITAPIFDNGVSLLFSITLDDPLRESKILDYDIFKNNTANNFLGSRDLWYNLNYIKEPVVLSKLSKSDKEKLYKGIPDEALPIYYKEKIWSIICLRYSMLRKLGLIVER